MCQVNRIKKNIDPVAIPAVAIFRAKDGFRWVILAKPASRTDTSTHARIPIFKGLKMDNSKLPKKSQM